MSDRSCTFGAHLNLTLSAQQMNSCCDECGDGCDGGQIDVPWQYWQSQGIVSAQCEPYTLPPCEHHVPNATNPCPMMDYPTPNCPTSTLAIRSQHHGTGHQWSYSDGFQRLQ